MELSQALSFIRPALISTSSFLHHPAWFFLSALALVLATSVFFKEQKRLPFLASAVAIALLLGFSSKQFFQETRPCLVAEGKIPCPQDYSLPSMHSLVAFTIALVAVGTRSFPFYLLFALFVAFSRIYLGVHTSVEVAAGLALSFFSCVLAELLFKHCGLEIPPSVLLRHGLGRLPPGSSSKVGDWLERR
ncbi:MAG: phosphatase PAP2 family protein [Candidatus Micrarchaeota archaeon]|nr:phosphatase PAP2 family protein [Candidatus Micrarchaeota archaeon]